MQSLTVSGDNQTPPNEDIPPAVPGSRSVRVVLRADDAGSCVSANTATEEVCNAGIVRNVSLMMCGPAFEDAADRFRGRTDLCLGLHVVLNAEWSGPRWGPVLPVEQVPTLIEANSGYFTHFPHDLAQKGFSVAEAVAEARAQLDRARDAGLMIRYLDEHMGVGWLPGLRAALADLAREEGLIDAIALSFPPLPATEDVNDTPESLADRWHRSIQMAEPGTYLVVTHPGKDAPDMQEFALTGESLGAIARERDYERRALIALARKAVIRPLRYDEI